MAYQQSGIADEQEESAKEADKRGALFVQHRGAILPHGAGNHERNRGKQQSGAHCEHQGGN